MLQQRLVTLLSAAFPVHSTDSIKEDIKLKYDVHNNLPVTPWILSDQQLNC